EPMPVCQSGLCTRVTPGRSTGAAPVTTTIGSAPPVRSSATPRAASVWPPTSTRALGWPSRLPPPAASRIPATRVGMRPQYRRGRKFRGGPGPPPPTRRWPSPAGRTELLDDLRDRDLQDVLGSGRLERRDQRV